jgi:hypothetical protein
VPNKGFPRAVGHLFVVAAVTAALGAASFGWVRRLQSPLPGPVLGLVALFVVPIAVPALLRRPGTGWSPRSLYALTVTALLSYVAALLFSYFASVKGSPV